MTATLPKFNCVALKVNCEFATVPVPLRATVVVGLRAELLMTTSVPVIDFAEAGVNCTCKVRDWLGVRVVGNEPATRLKPVPETVADFTVSGAVPEEVRAIDLTEVEFAATLPKLSDVAVVS